MKRRANKSHKVPNVKLRPAHPSAARHVEAAPTPMWIADSQMANETLDTGGCPRPFRGFLVCATGEMDKPTLFKQFADLGGMHTLAFTDQVTHLIAVDHGSDKYGWAMKCKVPILRPSWIGECHQTWLRGDDIDIELSMSEHKLPLFSDVVLSVSGIADIKRRTQIMKLVQKEQGTYVKLLERPVKVTHLLCSGSEETEQIRRARSFVQRGEAKIHIIWEEWFWDSFDFGGRWNEEDYDVDKPQPVRKLTQQLVEISVEENSSMMVSTNNGAVPAPQRQSPRAEPPPPEEDEVASVRRLGNDAMRIWESVLKPRGYELNGNKLVLSPSKALSQRGAPPPALPPRELPGRANDSVITSFRRDTTSFARPNAKSSHPRHPFRRIPTTAGPEQLDPEDGSSRDLMAPAGNQAETSAAGAAVAAADSSPKQLFIGYCFRILGEADCPTVRTAIEDAGGTVLGNGAVDFIVVRLVGGGTFYQQTPGKSERAKYRTECWLERCMFEERLCMPEEHIAMTPLAISTPIAGAEEIDLSLSGLDESEACWTRRLARALGISIASSFSRRSSHLLCPSGQGAKFDKALEWDIPVVNMGWIDEMATTGMIPPTADYSVVDIAGIFASESMEDSIHPSQQREETRSEKAKGKAKEVDAQMVDITNDIHQPEEQSHTFDETVHKVQRGSTIDPSDADSGIFGRPSLLVEPARHQSQSSSDIPRGSLTHEHRPTPAEIRREMREMTLPSSRSPSPLKIPGLGMSLENTIASVLGKRPMSNMEEAPGPAARPGKRSRPVSKANSRHFTRAPSDGSLYDLGPPEESAPHEIHREDGSAASTESMRILYEDPGQRESKRQLLKFLDPTIPDDTPEPTKKGRRRSARMAGF